MKCSEPFRSSRRVAVWGCGKERSHTIMLIFLSSILCLGAMSYLLRALMYFHAARKQAKEKRLEEGSGGSFQRLNERRLRRAGRAAIWRMAVLAIAAITFLFLR